MGMAKQRYSGHGIALGRVSDALGYGTTPFLGFQRIINYGWCNLEYIYMFTIYVSNLCTVYNIAMVVFTLGVWSGHT